MADRIKAARLARRMSIRQLAEKCGVSPAAVSHWETGRVKNLRNESLLKVSAALQVHMKWLLSGEGERDLKLPAEKQELFERWVASFYGLGVEQLRAMLPMLEATIAQQARGELQTDDIEIEPTPEVEK